MHDLTLVYMYYNLVVYCLFTIQSKPFSVILFLLLNNSFFSFFKFFKKMLFNIIVQFFLFLKKMIYHLPFEFQMSHLKVGKLILYNSFMIFYISSWSSVSFFCQFSFSGFC